MEIDTRGAREMFAALKRKTGMSYRDVVRGVTREILTAAAKRTKTTTPAKIKESVEKELRKPMNVNGDLIGRTKDGKVWYRGHSWGGRNFVLLDASGRANTNIRKAQKQVPGAIRGRRASTGVKLSSVARSEINRVVQAANNRRKRNLQEKMEKLGSSKAVWLEIMRQMAMQPTSTSGLSRAMKAKLHPSNRAAVSGRESGQGEQFAIDIRNQSRSSLAPKSGDGLNAFRFALRGKVKQFQTAAKKDLETYARRFAQRHGFDVS